jgi:hypothetical protein
MLSEYEWQKMKRKEMKELIKKWKVKMFSEMIAYIT